MKRGIRIFAMLIISLTLIAGVIAESIGNEKDIGEKLTEKGKSPLEITEVDLGNQPEGLNINFSGKEGIKIYEANVGENKPVFIITNQGKIIETQNISAPNPRMLLYFGLDKETNESLYLESATGVDLQEQGYVMLRYGSITGISTTLDAISGVGKVEIIIYKNNEEAGFRNTINIDSSGVQKDFDLQSSGVLNFKPGDEIKIYIKLDKGLVIRDILNLVEIITK